MEKNDQESNDTNKDHYLKHVHKMSHKITKTPFTKKTPFDFDQTLLLDESQPSNLHQAQHQPPVYNVSKSDFRDVVQKLTGSPAHAPPHAPTQLPHAPLNLPHAPPHAPPVKTQFSRLHKIRPPPLVTGVDRNLTGNLFSGNRPLLSPLPPLPAVHATAESPISAYMRCMAAPEFHAPPVMSPGGGFGCLPSPGAFGFPQLTPLSPTLPAASPRWKSG